MSLIAVTDETSTIKVLCTTIRTHKCLPIWTSAENMYNTMKSLNTNILQHTSNMQFSTDHHQSSAYDWRHPEKKSLKCHKINSKSSIECTKKRKTLPERLNTQNKDLHCVFRYWVLQHTTSFQVCHFITNGRVMAQLTQHNLQAQTMSNLGFNCMGITDTNQQHQDNNGVVSKPARDITSSSLSVPHSQREP